MKIKNSIKAVGTLKIELIQKDGSRKILKYLKNLVVDVGLNLICQRLKDASLNALSHMAIGTGDTAADNEDTALETQKSDRKAMSSVTVTDNEIEFVAIFDGATYADTITEAGLFNAASAGQMLSRVVFADTVLPSGDSIQITWTLTFANG
jgi:hypothetical protein